MFRKAVIDLQRKSAQQGLLKPLARWIPVAESTHTSTLRQTACSLQAQTHWSALAPGAPCEPQLRGFAAQAHQEQSAHSDNDKDAAQAAAEEVSASADADADAASSQAADNESELYDDLSPEETRAKLLEQDASLKAQQAEISEYKERLIRALADMENSRQRSALQADNSRRFAVQGFAKAMLDVADNLERAIGIVDSRSEDTEELDLEKVQALLTSLHDGVKLTDKILVQAFEQNGLERLHPLHEHFDPNLHNALFEAPMPDTEPGTIHTVVKAGYSLNGRVLRAAEVGVTPSH